MLRFGDDGESAPIPGLKRKPMAAVWQFDVARNSTTLLKTLWKWKVIGFSGGGHGVFDSDATVAWGIKDAEDRVPITEKPKTSQ